MIKKMFINIGSVATQLFILDMIKTENKKLDIRKSNKPASRSSNCTSMNVMLTPATANGYSHTERSPSRFHKRSWKDFYKI
jgi:hypothetical protein